MSMISLDDFKKVDPPKKDVSATSANNKNDPQSQSVNLIDLDIFKRVNLRVAKILSAEPIEGSDKLLKLKVVLGIIPPAENPENILEVAVGNADLNTLEAIPAESREIRQIIAGIGKSYLPSDLIGREIVIIANLEPRKLMGEESQGMLLAVTNEDGLPIILTPEREVEPGSQIR
ncbi:MAG: hypothetical protein Q8L47_03005 [bacterium]|nr:hypothetical protein [bacterium]